jgi:hypothetical protein
MLNVTVANIGELAVVGCEGRIVQSESAYKLREAVTSQTDARLIVVDSRKCVPRKRGSWHARVSATMGAGTQNTALPPRWQ